MLIVHVHVHVTADGVSEFKHATLENAAASLAEPGVVRFDIIEQLDDPTRFLLVEIYRDERAPARHKETAHYAKWRDIVAPLMAAPRTSIRYAALFPEPARFETPPGAA